MALGGWGFRKSLLLGHSVNGENLRIKEILQ
jgi:hypothetical protein